MRLKSAGRKPSPGRKPVKKLVKAATSTAARQAASVDSFDVNAFIASLSLLGKSDAAVQKLLRDISRATPVDFSSHAPLPILPAETNRISKRLGQRLPMEAGAKDPADATVELMQAVWPAGPHRKDKAAVLLMATAGSGGSGKTELLLHLVETLDTVRPGGPAMDENHPLRDHAEAFVVLFATFNQGVSTAYDDDVDTKSTIEKRTVQRFAADYFDPSVLDSSSVAGWPTLKLFLGQVRRMAQSTVHAKTGRRVEPERIGVLLCVDELMKIKDSETRSKLLEVLGSVRLSEDQAGLPTFVLVSSLQLWPTSEEWVTGSQRKMTAIPLPPLSGLDAVKARVPPRADVQERGPEAQQQWDITKHVKIDMQGGHPRGVEAALDWLTEQARHTGMLPKLQLDVGEATSERARKLWGLAFAAQVRGEDARLDAEDARWNPRVNELQSRLLFRFEPIDGTHPPRFRAVLRCQPWEFFAIAGTTEAHDDFPWLGHCVRTLWRTLTNPELTTLRKDWESGIVAALALRALAFAGRHLSTLADWTTASLAAGPHPTLEEVLPGALFAGRQQPATWHVPIKLVKAWCADVQGTELFAPTAASTDVTLLRRSTRTNQPGIEGTLELRLPDGTRAFGLTQNKLHTPARPVRVSELVAALRGMVKARNADAAGRGMPACCVLFVLGLAPAHVGELKTEIENFARDDDANVVVVHDAACAELLKPLGANALLHRCWL